MEQAKENIRAALSAAASPAVLCSFGKDSLLVLRLVLEIRPDTPVVWYRTAATNVGFARYITREWNLNVYGYAPADQYLLAQGSEVTLVQEYSVGDERLPVLTDLQDGTKCSLTAFPQRTPQMYLPFDLLLVGYKDCDTHWVKGGSELFGDNLILGRAKIVAPIRHMTDDAVRAALLELHIPYEESDDRLPLCTHCMTQNSDEVFCPDRGHYIPREQWDRELALHGFQKRFRLRS